MAEDLQEEIIQLCLQINQKCDIEVEDFCFEHLRARDWYLSILEILYPHLQSKLDAISKLPSETHAINKIVQEIDGLDQFEKIDIDAGKITAGDPNQIANMVQVVQALLEIAIEDYEEGGEGQEEQEEHQEQEELNGQIKAQPQQNQSSQKKKRPYSDYGKPKSAQAIDNQFQASDSEDDSVAIRNLQIHQPSEDQEFSPIEKQKLQMAKLGNLKKEVINQAYKSFPKPDPYEQGHNQHPLEQTKKVKKNKFKNPQKQHKINIKPDNSHKKKKLVTHPKSPEPLKKVKSSENIAMTRKTQQDIEKTRKKLKRVASPVLRAKSPAQDEIQRKNKEHHYVMKDDIRQHKQNRAAKLRKNNFDEKNAERLSKILKWREERMKKQRQQYEQSLKTKVALQKEQYIKKINNLIIKLEREKEKQQIKDYKEQFMKEYKEAERRLTALQQWYNNKISLLHENRKSKRQERLMIRTGHKEIIRQIEKYLKKQNEQKLFKLTEQCRNQQNNIENDFQELKQKVIKVYKKF